MLFHLIFIIALSFSPKPEYKANKAIVIVVDGPRYSETWGEPSKKHIPYMANELAKEGTVCTKFYNNGVTFTVPGHTAITTGNYQKISNIGFQLPKLPSFLQYYEKEKGQKAALVCSKGKLGVLGNCKEKSFKNKFLPVSNCGTNEEGRGYRNDSITFIRIIETLSEEKYPVLMINFKEPDVSGHANNWDGYLKGIQKTDEYIKKIKDFIDTNAYYKETTALFITNDHGRHLDGHKDGFRSHGDNCDGCKHIFLYAYGPDFKQNFISETPREQLDISATLAHLLGFSMPTSNGKVMRELFIEN
jgi:hypothetical protein